MLELIYGWFLASGLKITLIIIVALLINRFGREFIKKLVVKGVKDGTQEGTEKRQKTLVLIFSGALKILVWLVAIMMILSELGINIGPVLAGAGVLGVALGFGAQHMVRDFLAGLFVIIENQYRVGDVACLDATCGLVEDIDLRKTILRDLDGIVHYIPNGTVRKSSNLSKGFARVNLDVKISYGSNLEKVISIVDRVGQELADDPKWQDMVIKPPKFLRVNDFGDSAMVIKILGETKPLKQWDVTGELRKRIKIAFDKEGIEIPFPQMSIWPRGDLKK